MRQNAFMRICVWAVECCIRIIKPRGAPHGAPLGFIDFLF